MSMTKEYILACLDKYCTFDNLCEENFKSLVINPLQGAQCFNNWSWDNGVTKGVLIFKELDFVVKIPFCGQYFWVESHYEDSKGHWHWSGEDCSHSNMIRIEGGDELSEFTGAESLHSNWNYCAVEEEVACCAKSAGLEKCFAITEFLGTANNHPIYMQEKCFMFSDASSSTNREKYANRTKADYDSLKEIRERTDFWDINDDWLLDFVIYWGEEVLRKLGAFLFDNNIDDLHGGNIGYHNGVPCLVDYSSFRE